MQPLEHAPLSTEAVVEHAILLKRALAAGALTVAVALSGCTAKQHETETNNVSSVTQSETGTASDSSMIPSEAITSAIPKASATTRISKTPSPSLSPSATSESNTPGSPARSAPSHSGSVPSNSGPISASTPATTAPTPSKSTPGGSEARALYEPPDGTAYIGVATSSRNNQLTNFVRAVGMPGHPGIFNTFKDNAKDPNADIQDRLAAMQQAGEHGVDPALAGSTLMLSWGVTFSHDVIAKAANDAPSINYIRKTAREVAAYDKPIFIRLDWEMNSYSFTAYNQKGGTTPESYVKSWQRIRNIFKQIAPNAAFVWCPAKGEYDDPSGTPTPTNEWYPGDAYVDWIGIDGYPEYYKSTTSILTTPFGFNWAASFATVHQKPLMVAEYGRGSTPASSDPVPDAGTSFDVIFGWAKRNPIVKALVYFDLGPTHQLEPQPPTKTSSFPHGLEAYRKYTVGNKNFLYTIVR